MTLMLYIHVQAKRTGAQIDTITQALMVGAVIARYSFAARYIAPTDFIGATLTYICFGGLLIAAATY